MSSLVPKACRQPDQLGSRCHRGWVDFVGFCVCVILREKTGPLFIVSFFPKVKTPINTQYHFPMDICRCGEMIYFKLSPHYETCVLVHDDSQLAYLTAKGSGE